MHVERKRARSQRAAHKAGITAAQVATYIKLGRRKVTDTAFDPYAKYKNPAAAMQRDAQKIADWFNAHRTKWDPEHRASVLRSITNIQFGPQFFWKETLQELLSAEHFKAAASWAERHKAGHYVDVSLSVPARDAIFAVVNAVTRIDKMAEPYRAMLDVLRFVFHGLASDARDNALAL